jgi:hypothetical protein
MADCFVSYKREDEPRVRPIVDALRDGGLTVWWDREIPGGERWRETIVEQLDASSCVIVCWTDASAGPDGGYVLEEAERAKARGVLLPVRLDRVDPPFGFSEVQALDLVDWSGSRRDPRCGHFVATARAIALGKPRPRPPARKIRRWGAVGGAAALVAALVGFIQDISGLQSTLCRANGLRRVCRTLSLGGLPSVTEEHTWRDAQTRSDGEGYRAYLRAYPGGEFATQAHSRLAACRPEPIERWEPRPQSLPVFVGREPKAAASAEEARGITLRRVEGEARQLCEPFLSSKVYRLRGSHPQDEGLVCEEVVGRWYCSFNGRVTCDLEERTTSSREVCN